MRESMRVPGASTEGGSIMEVYGETRWVGIAAMAATACWCCCSGVALGLVGMRVGMAGGSTRGSTGKLAMP